MRFENILISSARSGTNYYMSIFQRMFPDACVLREIFRRGGDSVHLQSKLLDRSEQDLRALLDADPLELWAAIVEACQAAGRPALCKIFYYHQPRSSPLWERFHDRARIVHLIRRNQFDVYVSLQIAQQTGKWQQFQHEGPSPEVTPLLIHRTDYERFLRRQVAHVTWTRELYRDADYAEVFYEDIAASPGACLRALSRIHKCFPLEVEVDTNLRKQKTRANPELVVNYADLRDLDVPTFS